MFIKVVLGSFLIFLFTQAVGAQSCSSDEFVFDYYTKNRCVTGGTPDACTVIPKGMLAGLLGGAGYITGKKLGAVAGGSLGQRENHIRMAISDSAFNARLTRLGNLHQEWDDILDRALKGTSRKNELATNINGTRYEFFDGYHADDTQKMFDRDFIEQKDKLRLHFEGKKVLDAGQIAKIRDSINTIFENARYHLIRKEVEDKRQWMREGLQASKLMGARVGKIGLAAAGALVIPVSELVQKERLFSKCISKENWFSNQGDHSDFKSFIDIDNDCTINVNESSMTGLVEMSPLKRKDFFAKCPSCCLLLQKRGQEMLDKIDKEAPQVVMDGNSCHDDSIQVEVVQNGSHYHHNYKKSHGQYILTTALIPNNDDINRNNKMTIAITAEGHFTNPMISNVNAGTISTLLQSENMSPKLVQWYDSLKEKNTPPKNFADLADARKVQYSAAEQIKAANYSFRAIKNFCENKLGKKSSTDLPDVKSGAH